MCQRGEVIQIKALSVTGGPDRYQVVCGKAKGCVHAQHPGSGAQGREEMGVSSGCLLLADAEV